MILKRFLGWEHFSLYLFPSKQRWKEVQPLLDYSYNNLCLLYCNYLFICPSSGSDRPLQCLFEARYLEPYKLNHSLLITFRQTLSTFD